MVPSSSNQLNGSSLNPAAPVFTVPAQTNAASNGVLSTTMSQPAVNGLSKAPKKKDAPDKSAQTSTADTSVGASGGKKLSAAELKKQKAAEKAARRQEKLSERVESLPAGPTQVQASSQSQTPQLQRRPSGGKKDNALTATHHKRTGSSAGKALPIRPTTANLSPEAEKKPKEDKRVSFFSHLYSREKRTSIAGASKEIHPAVLALGLQLRDHVICGGNARCVATLLVFKKVIQAYTTPPGTALSRHLTTHLSHQISHLSHSRPLSVSQGNSIRWLKKLISTLDVGLSDSEAISFVCRSIDSFIREKVTLADELISQSASSKIVDGDVVLTYAKSSVVEKTLLAARRQGKQFKVIVVDSRPLFEGRNLARSLAAAGVQTQYCLLAGLSNVVAQVTKCLLGASAMMGNGGLYSRAGTALVALMAKEGRCSGIGAKNVPVVVLCESVKFTSRVALDSVVGNELGDADALVESPETSILTYTGSDAGTATVQAKGAKKGGKNAAEGEESADASKQKRGLEGWNEQLNLQLLNPMYDVTPAEYLDMIITELGSLPPSAVPVVNGIWGGEA